MALIAILLAASLSADPPRLLLGKDAVADLTLRAPPGAKVTLSSSVGTIGAPRRDGDVVHARFTPPPVKAPSVALVLAEVEQDGARELAWLSIPLSGSDTMEIETRPGARVSADVGGSTIGPVTADKAGTARLPMVVPPGVREATLHITDKLGNSGDKPLDLDPPPFSRLRLAARSASANAAAPLEVEIFVVRPDGSPDDSARVELLAKDGETDVRKRIGPGVYLARYIPPEKKSGLAHLEAKAAGQLAATDVPVSAGKPTIGQRFWHSALVAQRPWSVSAGLLGGGGATFDGAGAGSVLLEAALRLESLPVEAVVDVGASWFSTVTQYGPNPLNAEQARSQSRLVEAGVRAGTQLTRGLDGHATLLFGAQSQVVGRTLPTGGAQVANDAWTPRLAFALGANLQAGPGRALVQVQFDASPSGIAGLAGSLGGVQAMLGYLVTVY